MRWEHLTSPDFARAVKETGVCVVAMGVIEKHGNHLPLGTDVLNSHRVCCLAAEKEPAVVFPPFYFGQIYEARCYPGTVTIKPTLLLDLITGVCDEIGRNGFRKIILFNGHGGNEALLPFIAQSTLWEEKPYSIYVVPLNARFSPEQKKLKAELMDTELHSHGCECETSISLFNHAELVKMEDLDTEGGQPLERGSEIANAGLFTGSHFYAKYPDHYAGDARSATIEKGEKLVEMEVAQLAGLISMVKQDKAIPAIEAEFHSRTDHH